MSKKLSLEKFIEKSIRVHGEKFDYSKTIYINNRVHVTIICNDCHATFMQVAGEHLRGVGCASCFGNKKLNNKSYIERAIGIHGNKYNYSKVKYVNAVTDIEIICNRCHTNFKQNPIDHLRLFGCAPCGLAVRAEEQFVLFLKCANILHDNKFDYSNSVYINNKTHVDIHCKDCDIIFSQRPDAHLCGHGCPKCAKFISKSEVEWLNSQNVLREHRQKTLKIGSKTYKVDAFNPETKTVYEFYGDFWHGNPKVFKAKDINMVNHKTFGELFTKTILKENAIKLGGYNHISIWEYDWKQIIT